MPLPGNNKLVLSFWTGMFKIGQKQWTPIENVTWRHQKLYVFAGPVIKSYIRPYWSVSQSFMLTSGRSPSFWLDLSLPYTKLFLFESSWSLLLHTVNLTPSHSNFLHITDLGDVKLTDAMSKTVYKLALLAVKLIDLRLRRLMTLFYWHQCSLFPLYMHMFVCSGGRGVSMCVWVSDAVLTVD